MAIEPGRTNRASQVTVLLTNFRPGYLSAVAKFITIMQGVHLVDAVADGHDAATRELDPPPDVIVCGFSLFVPHTLEPFSLLRSKFPRAWIIGTSLDPDGKGEVLALGNGADEYLTGYDLDTHLEATIKRDRNLWR